MTAVSYTADPIVGNLPLSLRPCFECICRLARATGYAFAKVAWYMQAWGVKRWKVYHIINRLIELGYIRAVDVPGSHDRYLYPISLAAKTKRKSNQSQTKSRGDLITAGTSLKREDNVADTVVVSILQETGISESEATTLARRSKATKEQAARARAIVEHYRQRGKQIANLGAFITAALRDAYLPPSEPHESERAQVARRVLVPTQALERPHKPLGATVAPPYTPSAPGAAWQELRIRLKGRTQ